jgi:hypothetical protein
MEEHTIFISFINKIMERKIFNILCLQFYEGFATHFSPHQFGVAIKGGCEVIIHNIRCTLDLHRD